jgi:chorismate mutase
VTIRGIRGATDVPENTAAAIDRCTQELLCAMVAANNLEIEQIVSVFLTATVDLDTAYPAASARAMGWTNTPLLDAQEIDVKGGMPRVIRVLMHVESTCSHDQIHHIYLGNAVRLRPDITNPR